MGIAPPRAACDDHEIYNEATDDDDPAYTPITETVRKIYEAYVNVYSFHAAYVTPVINDDDFGDEELYLDYTGCLLQLAASKIEIDTAIAPKFDAFKLSWIKQSLTRRAGRRVNLLGGCRHHHASIAARMPRKKLASRARVPAVWSRSYISSYTIPQACWIRLAASGRLIPRAR
jgi:hypothetical protein